MKVKFPTILLLERWEESKVANIVQGYTFKLNENNPENNQLDLTFLLK
jgi:hypothetical protein